MNSIILLTDSYKVGQYLQHPPGTSNVYSYFESRGGFFDETLFFGLQYIIKKYLVGKVVTEEGINFAKSVYAKHLDYRVFNEDGWRYILNKHNGKLPIVIKAVPEGTIVPVSNILFSVENTDKECFWLTDYLETLFMQTWYPTTIATVSYYAKKIILEYLEKTGTPEAIDFKLHDFGCRSSTSMESAGIGGASHLVSFKGTDTVPALLTLMQYYNSEVEGFSVPAAQHSTITSWGRENEYAAFQNMLEKFSYSTIISVVSDSYNIYEACRNLWGAKLKDKVLNMNGTLVVRPDSGVPKDIALQVIQILENQFGSTINEKGYKVLYPKVRVIIGDGINLNSMKGILEHLEKHRYSADNIVFGMGTALLQNWNRDSQKFAFKCSSVTINGEDRDVYKEPITDKGKVSKRGKLKLVMLDGTHGKVYHTMQKNLSKEEDVLEEVFKNGELKKEYSFKEIRERTINSSIKYWDRPLTYLNK